MCADGHSRNENVKREWVCIYCDKSLTIITMNNRKTKDAWTRVIRASEQMVDKLEFKTTHQGETTDFEEAQLKEAVKEYRAARKESACRTK